MTKSKKDSKYEQIQICDQKLWRGNGGELHQDAESSDCEAGKATFVKFHWKPKLGM